MAVDAVLPETRFDELLSLLKLESSRADPRLVLQTVSSEFGPWEMAHYLLLAEDQEGAMALRRVLAREDPCAAYRMDTLIGASRWQTDLTNEDLARDFGSE
jgi:hypothetical protein